MEFTTTIKALEIIFKLFLACVLGGIIGLERESVNRPAGFRTHILVIVGATIVMITNMELVTTMASVAEVQPGRFGAAVISGIGFLGAGTIIKEGNSVKGLTTAASLWATACIGLSLGAGLYLVSLVATVFVFLTLEFFPKIEKKLSRSKSCTSISINASNEIGQLAKITNSLEKLNINITGIKTKDTDEEKDENIHIHFRIKCPSSISKSTLMATIHDLSGITEVVVDPK